MKPILAMSLILMLAGCGTLVQDPFREVTPDRVEAVARLSGYVSAKAIVLSDPGRAEPLQAILAGLTDLEKSQRWDIATAAAIASANGLTELTSSEGAFAIQSSILFLDLVLGRKIDLSADPFARAFIVGLKDGLQLALSVRNFANPSAAGQLQAAAMNVR